MSVKASVGRNRRAVPGKQSRRGPSVNLAAAEVSIGKGMRVETLVWHEADGFCRLLTI